MFGLNSTFSNSDFIAGVREQTPLGKGFQHCKVLNLYGDGDKFSLWLT